MFTTTLHGGSIATLNEISRKTTANNISAEIIQNQAEGSLQTFTGGILDNQI